MSTLISLGKPHSLTRAWRLGSPAQCGHDVQIIYMLNPRSRSISVHMRQPGTGALLAAAGLADEGEHGARRSMHAEALEDGHQRARRVAEDHAAQLNVPR